MADNTIISVPSGASNGDTIATDDIGGVKYPRSKITLGADGTNDGDVSSANPLPVTASALPLPTGAATAANQSTIITAVQAIQTAVQLLDNAVAGNEFQVDIVTSALPSGAATEAKQDTIITAVQAIQTAVQILDNAVSGNEFQVDIVSMPAVDTELPTPAALADDTANPTVPAVGAFGMMYDGATWDRLKGNATDGLLVNLGANNDVTIGAALPAGGNTIGDVTISGNALTSLQLLDDIIFADDAAFTPDSSKVAAVGFLFDDVSSDTVNEGDIGIGRMSARREQYIQIRDAAGNERGANVDASGRLSVAIGSSITITVTASGADGDLYVGSKPTHIVGGFDGSTLKAWSMDSSGNGQVDIVGALPAGTNNIGDVDVLTQPARAATTDTITAKLATDTIQNGTTALTPKFAIIDAATSGDNTLVTAVASKKIRVLSLFLVSAGTVTARFESGAGGTALTGQMNLVASSGFCLPFNPVGWFETASNTLLNLELSGAVSVDGCLTYVEV